MTIVSFRPRPRKQCAACLIPFSPLSSSHAFCAKCYRLGKAGAYVAAAHALFRAASEFDAGGNPYDELAASLDDARVL